MSKLQDIRNLAQEHAVSVAVRQGIGWIIWIQHQDYIGILFLISF